MKKIIAVVIFALLTTPLAGCFGPDPKDVVGFWKTDDDKGLFAISEKSFKEWGTSKETPAKFESRDGKIFVFIEGEPSDVWLKPHGKDTMTVYYNKISYEVTRTTEEGIRKAFTKRFFAPSGLKQPVSRLPSTIF